MKKPTMEQIKQVHQCITVWEWQYDNPLERKDINPHIEPNINNLCHLCEEWFDECGLSDGGKSDCPLNTQTLLCDKAKNNPYTTWIRATYRNDKKESQRNSRRIINACKRWLKKYGVE